MLRLIVISLFLTFGLPAGMIHAQEPDRSATGGAQTLEDILARQRGEEVDDSFRRNLTGDPEAAAPITGQLGTLGGASDPDLWRALRFDSANVTVSDRGPASGVIMQDAGIRWLEFRTGPLRDYGTYAVAAMLGILVLFFLLRGRIRIDGEKTGRTVTRFSGFERFGHWLFAGSFIILGITGLLSLYGRDFVMPLIGKEAFSAIALASKWLHNNLAWAFMLGLVIITVTWVVHNIPNRHDLKWLAKAGGLFTKGSHPPARKFNAGQKIIFWACIALGVSISASGLSLLFPFQLPMFEKTFVVLNATGLPQAMGLVLPEQLGPHQEMQYAQL